MGGWDNDAPPIGDPWSPADEGPLSPAERSRAVRAAAEELALLENLASNVSNMRNGVAPSSVRRETVEGLLKRYPDLQMAVVGEAMQMLTRDLRERRASIRALLDSADAADATDGGIG